MSAPEAQAEDQTLRQRYEALVRERGPDGFIDYIQQVSPGRGDYTAERHKLFEGISVDDLEEWWARKRAANGEQPYIDKREV